MGAIVEGWSASKWIHKHASSQLQQLLCRTMRRGRVPKLEAHG